MKWVKTTLVALVAVAVLVVAWMFLFPSPERVIKKRLAEVEEIASFGPNEAPLAKVANASKLAGFFTRDVEVMVEIGGRQREAISGREDLLRAAVGVRNQLQSFNVDLLDPQITFGADKQTAIANLTARANVPGERDFMIQELDVELVRQGRDWLIRRIATVKTLR